MAAAEVAPGHLRRAVAVRCCCKYRRTSPTDARLAAIELPSGLRHRRDQFHRRRSRAAASSSCQNQDWLRRTSFAPAWRCSASSNRWRPPRLPRPGTSTAPQPARRAVHPALHHHGRAARPPAHLAHLSPSCSVAVCMAIDAWLISFGLSRILLPRGPTVAAYVRSSSSSCSTHSSWRYLRSRASTLVLLEVFTNWAASCLGCESQASIGVTGLPDFRRGVEMGILRPQCRCWDIRTPSAPSGERRCLPLSVPTEKRNRLKSRPGTFSAPRRKKCPRWGRAPQRPHAAVHGSRASSQ